MLSWRDGRWIMASERRAADRRVARSGSRAGSPVLASGTARSRWTGRRSQAGSGTVVFRAADGARGRLPPAVPAADRAGPPGAGPDAAGPASVTAHAARGPDRRRAAGPAGRVRGRGVHRLAAAAGRLQGRAPGWCTAAARPAGSPSSGSPGAGKSRPPRRSGAAADTAARVFGRYAGSRWTRWCWAGTGGQSPGCGTTRGCGRYFSLAVDRFLTVPDPGLRCCATPRGCSAPSASSSPSRSPAAAPGDAGPPMIMTRVLGRGAAGGQVPWERAAAAPLLPRVPFPCQFGVVSGDRRDRPGAARGRAAAAGGRELPDRRRATRSAWSAGTARARPRWPGCWPVRGCRPRARCAADRASGTCRRTPGRATWSGLAVDRVLSGRGLDELRAAMRAAEQQMSDGPCGPPGRGGPPVRPAGGAAGHAGRVRGRGGGLVDRLQPGPAGPGAGPAAGHAVRRPAAPGGAGPDPVRRRARRCCWTSPPTTWTPTRWPGCATTCGRSAAALVVISHDTALLDAVVGKVFHLDADTATLDMYNVGWQAYLEQRETDARRRQRENANAHAPGGRAAGPGGQDAGQGDQGQGGPGHAAAGRTAARRAGRGARPAAGGAAALPRPRRPAGAPR